jgi:predicted Zn-dependent protease
VTAGRPVTAGALEPAGVVAERALAAATLDGCVVVVVDVSETEVRFAANTTTTNGARRDRRVTVVAVGTSSSGPTVGTATTSGAADVAALVRAAEADALAAPAADDAADLVAGDGQDDLSELAPTTGVAALAPVIDGLGAAFAEARATGHVLAGFVEHRLETVTLASSTGLRRRHVQPTGKVQLAARTADGGRGAWVGRELPDLAGVSLTDLHADLRRRLAWGERSISLPAGRYETILPPDAVADLLVPLADALGQRDAEEGHSVFAAPGGGTRLGERLARLPVALRSDPAEPGLECTPFAVATASSPDTSVFDNGLPLEATAWIDGGRLARLRAHRARAARSRVPVAPPVDNLVLEVPGATSTVDDLVARTERGLLLTCLWYLREVDPTTLLLTGITRDGVYLVEGGEVVGSVNNFRFNESPVDLLARAVEGGRSEHAFSREWNEHVARLAMPALRVPDFNMSSVSPAV